jgi:4-amino-4-deoxy-L-arabinose transferase-like glycosyltransferase
MNMMPPDLFKSYRLPLIGGAIFILLISFAFFERHIQNDEAWIGQQVLSLANTGVVRSELFRDLPPLNQQIVVYHKLLVWVGVAITYLFGWGLYPLRGISFFSGMLLLLIILLDLRRRLSPRIAAFTVLILMFAPIFSKQMLEFRPEALLLLCGFTGFLLLWSGAEQDSIPLYLIAGILSGLAGLAHAFGLACVGAGLVALLFTRRWKGAIIFGVAGLIAFAPYLSGYLTHPELFRQQTLDNPLMTTSFQFKWWHIFTSLLSEHERVLRKPEDIGITVSFLLALLLVLKEQWRKYKLLWVYLAALFVIIGASPLPKFTRYMIPLVPPMAIVIAQVWDNLRSGKARGRHWAAVLFLIWQVVFFGYGTYALLREAIPDKVDELKTNEAMLAQMSTGSTVIAPFDFVFPADPVMTIQCWWGADRHDREHHDIATLEHYADSLGIDYLIFGPFALDKWNLNQARMENEFKEYELIGSWSVRTKEPRYLFKRE